VPVVSYCLLFLLAETTALEEVRTGRPSEGADDLVSAAIWLLLLMAVFVPLQPHFEALLDRTPAYRLKVWLWRRTGVLNSDDPDPPRAYAGMGSDGSRG
jgi:hypothetical protein